MNDASRSTLKGLEKYLPDKVDKLVGQKIDIFHKRPEHQKKIISDQRNLPHKAKITVGPETLDLLVSALLDSTGKYIGPIVTWSVITSNLKLARELEETAGQLAAAADLQHSNHGLADHAGRHLLRGSVRRQCECDHHEDSACKQHRGLY